MLLLLFFGILLPTGRSSGAASAVVTSSEKSLHYESSLPYARFKWPSDGLISSSNRVEIELNNVFGAMGNEVSIGGGGSMGEA